MKHSGILILLLCAAAAAPGAESRYEKKFTVSPGGTLRLETEAGSVRVTGTPSSEVEVIADLRGRARDVEDFKVTATQSGSDVEVTGMGKRSGWFFWSNGDLDVQFTIRVPQEYNLRIATAGGDVDVAGLKGSVDSRTSGGNVMVSEVDGKVVSKTSGGDVRAEKVTGQLRMQTSGGNVRIHTVRGDVDAHTSGGNVQVMDVDGKVEASTSGGNVTVKIVGENKGVNARTSGGDVEIVVGPDVAATIDAATSGGSVECDLPITMQGKFDESRLRGTIHGGGEVVYARTSGGNIRIRASN